MARQNLLGQGNDLDKLRLGEKAGSGSDPPRAPEEAR